MKIIFNLLFCLLACIACHPLSEKDRQLEEALEFAGKNRPELEKVLAYYQNDSAKLEAAKFLITYMPYRYYYASWELDTMKKLKAEGALRRKDLAKWSRFNYRSLPKLYDSKVITANYLIENIDLAFQAWREHPWNQFMSKEVFYEYVLPYRVGNEPLENWRQTYYDFYHPILDSLYQGSDVIQAADCISRYLENDHFYYIKEYDLPHLGALFLMKHKMGTCVESSDYPVYVMRALGIPISTDYFLFSPQFSGLHIWNALIDTTGKSLPYVFYNYGVSRDFVDQRKKGKVYRVTYSLQKEAKQVFDRDLDRCFQDKFSKDVTEEYFGRNQVSVDVPETMQGKYEGNYMYLSVFHQGEWIPIDTASIQKGKAVFRNIEPDLYYMPILYAQSRYLPAGHPLTYTDSGTHFFRADTLHTETVCLTRKYPFQSWILEYLGDMQGGKIEASNDLRFSHPQLIHPIEEAPTKNYNRIECTLNTPYRYFRYQPAPHKKLEIAEILFFNRENKEVALDSKIYYSTPFTDPEHLSAPEHANDKDPLTFFTSLDINPYIVYDLQTRQNIQTIIYIPRNDDNFVWRGDEYELFYQDGIQGWRSLGRQTAVTDTLWYTNVPQNALLWLKDHTKGKEEQVFSYVNGKQVFP